MKCKKCDKPIKENTAGNNRYCQGHYMISGGKEESKHQTIEKALDTLFK